MEMRMVVILKEGTVLEAVHIHMRFSESVYYRLMCVFVQFSPVLQN